jgi:hypothetical protein
MQVPRGQRCSLEAEAIARFGALAARSGSEVTGPRSTVGPDVADLLPSEVEVELFDDREGPEAVTRVKQAAILYDEVVIEDGLFTVAISTQGGNSWWEPWSWVDEEKLKHTRRKGKPGRSDY